MSPPPGIPTGTPTRTKLGWVSVPRNVITHAKFEINRFIIVALARGLKLPMLALHGPTPLTQLSPAGLLVIIT